MKLIQITPLPADADAADLATIFAVSPPGSAFSLELGDGRLATIVLGCVDVGQPQRVRDAYIGLFPRITQRCLAGLSIHAACLELAFAGEVPGYGTEESKARELGRAYRDAHRKLKATAFSDKTIQNTESAKSDILLSNTGTSVMQNKSDKALAPDKVVLIRRRPPQRYHIDLDAEGLGDATRDEILDPLFWRDVTHSLQQGDVVSHVSANGFNGDIIIGPESADGGFHVAVLGEHAARKPVATFEPSEAA